MILLLNARSGQGCITARAPNSNPTWVNEDGGKMTRLHKQNNKTALIFPQRQAQNWNRMTHPQIFYLGPEMSIHPFTFVRIVQIVFLVTLHFLAPAGPGASEPTYSLY